MVSQRTTAPARPLTPTLYLPLVKSSRIAPCFSWWFSSVTGDVIFSTRYLCDAPSMTSSRIGRERRRDGPGRQVGALGKGFPQRGDSAPKRSHCQWHKSGVDVKLLV